MVMVEVVGLVFWAKMGEVELIAAEGDPVRVYSITDSGQLFID